MRRLLALLLAACATSANAATIGIYFDARGRFQTTEVIFGVPFEFHVVARDLETAFFGWRLCIVVPDGISILSLDLHPMTERIGSGLCPGYRLSECLDPPELITLATFTGVYRVTPPPSDDLICAWAPPTSPFPQLVPYFDCEFVNHPLELAALPGTSYRAGCGVIDATQTIGVPAQTASWGALKALYDPVPPADLSAPRRWE